MTTGENTSREPDEEEEKTPSTQELKGASGSWIPSNITSSISEWKILMIDGLMDKISGEATDDGVYEPPAMQFSDLVMLSSALGFTGILLIFYSFEQFWYDNFGVLNTVLFFTLSLFAFIGMFVLLFIPPNRARKEDLFGKRKIMAITGFITFAVSAILVFVFGMESNYAMFFSIVGGLALYLLMISGEGISRREAHKLFIFVVGAIMLVFVPSHETFGFYSLGYGMIPLEPWNEVLVIVGAALLIIGFMTMRVSSTYFAAWLYGVFVLLLICTHELADVIDNNVYEPFDRSLLMIGAVVLLSGYGMSLYTYLTFLKLQQHINRGHEAFARDDLYKANLEYDRSFKLCEDLGILMEYDSLWGFKGNTLVKDGRLEEGIAYLKVGLSVNPGNHLLWNDIGDTYFHSRKLESALECYRQARTLRPELVIYTLNTGITLSRLGRYEEGIAQFDTAIEMAPDTDMPYIEKGRTLGRMGKYEEGDNFLKEAIKINPRSTAHLYRGTNYMMKENYGKAMECFDKYISIRENSVEAWLGKGRTLLKLSRPMEAQQILHSTVDIIKPGKDDRLHAEVLVEIGISYLMLAEYQEALEHFDRASGWDHDNVDAIMNHGRTLVYLKEFDDAVNLFARAVGKMRYSSLTAEKYNKIVENYRTILSYNPDDERAMLGMASTYRRMKRYREALAVLEDLLQIRRKSALGWNLKGAVLHKMGDAVGAIKALDQATALDENMTQAWNNLGNVHFMNKDYARALQCYNKAMELKLDNPLTVRNRLVCINNLSIKDLTMLKDIDDADIDHLVDELAMPEVQGKMQQWRKEGIVLGLIMNELKAEEDNIKAGRKSDFMIRFRRFEKQVEELKELRSSALAAAHRIHTGDLPGPMDDETQRKILRLADRVEVLGNDPARLGEVRKAVSELEMLFGRPLMGAASQTGIPGTAVPGTTAPAPASSVPTVTSTAPSAMPPAPIQDEEQEENIEDSLFPRNVGCVNCGKKYYVAMPATFKCKECGTRFRVNDGGGTEPL